MPTQSQIKNLSDELKKYRNRYLKKQWEDLDESATRIMVNSLLTDVLGYKELEDIKTEYRIRGEYADYVIQLARKKHFVVEVKSIQLDLNEKHLRQSINYAANEGIDWIILTNGKQIELYKVIFEKPISYRKIFNFDLSSKEDLKVMPEFLIYLTKKSVLKNELENFWKRFEALEPSQLSKNLYAEEVVKFLKKILKKKTDLNFSEEDVLDSLHRIIITKIQSDKPKNPLIIFNKKQKSPSTAHTIQPSNNEEELINKVEESTVDNNSEID